MTVRRRYPVAPLAAAMGLPEGEACRQLGWSGSQAKTRRRDGIPEAVADRAAVKIGRLAYDIWPEMVGHQIEDLDALVRARRNRAMRRWRAKPAGQAATKRQNDRYYAETPEYQKRRARERYWSDPERHRAARRERYARAKAS